MDDAALFEPHRAHLRGVAYRMLGSLSEADDAVQEAWLRLARSDTDGVANLRAWLTTVVSRVCLDMLRSRASRREDPLDVHVPDPVVRPLPGHGVEAPDGPEDRAVLADSVGLALLVVLDTLSPSERLAFVLHDVFAVPFDEIGTVLDRSPGAAKQLASRARARLRAAGPHADPGRVRGADARHHRDVVRAFVAASRDGDLERLARLLAPDVTLHADAGAGPAGPSRTVRGVDAVVAQARQFAALSSAARVVLVNGVAGVLVAPRGKPFAVIGFTVDDGLVTELDILADPERLARLDLTTVLN
ncbi:RNA polymerase sigma factor SigJ [Luteimicrobium xylanilyticum]|uniref:Putative ECF RNA polymerase sigma factor SigI n=1 Tax=Luteimicrobium xylanilyticum TaxID=1133546 RepID=A0A5P9Q9X6_9MICO|nr:sigma-70 family RNA polymerase sigma factor [Luteimicrobium xylanilyticum]QFU98251.1 putative ECF RNA polymerase sigma factor SigI [Luteimicrobium xylanilyticum]